MEMCSKLDWYIREHFECYTNFVFVSAPFPTGETMGQTAPSWSETHVAHKAYTHQTFPATSAHCVCYGAQPTPPVAKSPEISDNPPSTTS